MLTLNKWLQIAPAYGYKELNTEISGLSAEERLKALRDVYGVSDNIVETPEYLRSKLEELDKRLYDISEKEACEMASFVCPQYAESPQFRLPFLRAESFDVDKAAKKLVKYWDRKVQIFGTDKAFRALSMIDLDDDCAKALERGGVRMLPVRDEAGRQIILLDRSNWNQTLFSAETMIKSVWYWVHVYMEDERIQKAGAIVFMVPSGDFFAAIHGQFKVGKCMNSDVKEALPIKILCIHRFCLNPVLKRLVEHTLILFEPSLRARLRQYDGNAADNKAELQQYGIPLDRVPTELGGTLVFDFQSWIKTRLNIELQRYSLPNGADTGMEV